MQGKVKDELQFTKKGFISTTLKRKAAIDFIEEDQQCCLLVLTLPKGSKALYIGATSRFSDFGEEEILLPHGSKFEITRRRYITINKNRKILSYSAKLIYQP